MITDFLNFVFLLLISFDQCLDYTKIDPTQRQGFPIQDGLKKLPQLMKVAKRLNQLGIGGEISCQKIWVRRCGP